MVPGGMLTKWRSLVVSDASRMPAGGLKWMMVSVLMWWPGGVLSRMMLSVV